MGEWDGINSSSIYTTVWRCIYCNKDITLTEWYDLLDSLHVCSECNSLMWLVDILRND